MKELFTKKNLITFVAVVASSVMMASVTKTFTRPAGILSGGFMGIAMLADMLAEKLGFYFPTALGLVCLNLPVAIFCFKKISPRFVCFSLLHVACTSFMLEVVPSYPLMEEIMLNVIFGGFLYGISIVVVLKGNASTGGTDFIALYVSNKSGKEIWIQVFCFNALVLCIYGCIFGFELAGYSILFQFLVTKTISTFHIRYQRVMLHIFTKRKDEVVDAYVDNFRHGMTVLDGYGGYSKQEVTMLTAIVSSYEMDDVIEVLQKVDPALIVNVTKSQKYVGRFYMRPLD